MKTLILAGLLALGALAGCSDDSVKPDTRVPDKSGIIDRAATEGGGAREAGAREAGARDAGAGERKGG